MVYKKPNTPEEKQTRYLYFCHLRNERRPAEDIAKDLLEPDSLPRELYLELSKEGFPVCQECGAYSADESFCTEHLRKTKQMRKPGIARLGGEAIKLPPASEAKDLFREAIAELSKLIDPPEVLSGTQGGWGSFLEAQKARHNLDQLEEYLQGKHIVSYSVEDRANVPVIYRKDFTAEEWENVCVEEGVSPSAERIIFEDISAIPYGAQRAPAEILVKLIGVYILAGKPLEPLVEKLHHAPETVDLNELSKKLADWIDGYSTPSKEHVPGMLDDLRRIATAVRGGIIHSGRLVPFSDTEVKISRRIEQMQSHGLTRQEIYEELKKKGLTPSDVDRLAKSSPKQPDWELPD